VVKPTGHARFTSPVESGGSFEDACREVFGDLLGLLRETLEISGQLDGLVFGRKGESFGGKKYTASGSSRFIATKP